MKREIEEYPLSPPLSMQAVELLTHLCFRKDDVDIPLVACIFIFGSTISLDGLVNKICDLINKRISRKIVITGGNVVYHGSKQYEISQAKMIYQKIQSFLPNDIDVILEEGSQNTLENVHLGLSLLTTSVSSLCFITKNFHSGRSYLTLRRYLTTASIFQCSYDVFYPDINLKIQANDWYQHPQGRARIWGEFLRIKEYGKRKDISIKECKEIISKIDEIVPIL